MLRWKLFELICSPFLQNSQGSAKLPKNGDMWKYIEKNSQENAEKFYDSRKHTIQADSLIYMDDIAEQIGCKPNIGQYLFVFNFTNGFI